MTTHMVDCTWQDGLAFEVDVGGSKLTIDAAPEHGGQGRGPRPKPLLLAALAGCTGMDVAAILRKMRQPLQHLRVRVEGDLTEGGYPVTYGALRIVYEVGRTPGLDPAKVARAVALSQDKYCGVSAMLRQAAPIAHEIRYVDPPKREVAASPPA